MLTPDLPPITYDRPPIVRRDQCGGASSITSELDVLTLAVSPGIAEAIRERIASRAIEELQRYARFRRGWDGYDGRPFPADVITAGIYLIRVANLLCKIGNGQIDAIIPGPAGDGSIDIEFRRGAKTLIVTMYADA